MNIKNYISDFRNIKWDFTDEFACDAYREINNPLKKYFIYRSPRYNTLSPTIYSKASKFIKQTNDQYGLLQDPDAKSELLQDIYKILWPELVKEEFMMYKGRIQSDTMTSSQHSVNQIVRRFVETNDEKIFRGKNKVSNLYCLELYSKDKTGFIEKLDNIPNLKEFIKNYHTLGNYIAVPYLFNGARSGSYASHDYWDLTLQKIYEWYIEIDAEKKKNIIDDLLHHKGNLNTCSKWLEYFGKGSKGWQKFIDIYYLQDFVDAEYLPIPLCKNHSWENNSISDYKEFLVNVTTMITSRIHRMYDVLRKSTPFVKS